MNFRCWASTCFITLLIAAQARGGNADFLVVEKVEGLLIYNKYQQEASTRERQVFVPFEPMRILNAHETLADGFTHCMRVEVDGQSFYLLKDNEGTLSGSGPLGVERTFTNAAVILDTIQILANRHIRLSPVNSSAPQLLSNERILRIFRHQDRFYCRTLDSQPTYGWVSFAGTREGRDWEVLHHEPIANAAVPPNVVQKIQARLDETNSLLGRLFTFFNIQTHQQKPPPRWNIETSGNAVFCTLEGASSNDDFEQSTFYLVNAIENIVMGSEYEVTHSPGRIEIQQK
jgi:hypothetical protein